MKSSFVTRTEELDARLDTAIDTLHDLDRAAARVDARRSRCVAEVARIADERAALVSGGSEAREQERKLVAVEIAAATLRSERTVAQMINQAEELVTGYPATLAALETGQVSALHVRHLIAHASTLPAEARPGFEARLLDEAAVMPPHRFTDKARRMRETAHPESITVRNQLAQEKRSVFLSNECDGMATLTHYLPAVDAIAIDDLLDKIARTERTTTCAGTGADSGSGSGSGAKAGAGAEPVADPRTHQQRPHPPHPLRR
jgi:hypothetical protein